MTPDDAPAPAPASLPLYAQRLRPGDRLKAVLGGSLLGVLVILFSIWWAARPTP